MGVKIVVPPTSEPVSVAEAKQHLRVDHADEDAYIATLISAAREACEQELDRSVASQELMLMIDAFPDDAILLPRGPVTAIVSVQYVNDEGTLSIIPGSEYALDDAQIDAWLLRATEDDWPQAADVANAVRIQYAAGWSVCPAPIKHWILLAVGSMYANREADSDRPVVPQGFAARLLDRYRIAPV